MKAYKLTAFSLIAVVISFSSTACRTTEVSVIEPKPRIVYVKPKPKAKPAPKPKAGPSPANFRVVNQYD